LRRDRVRAPDHRAHPGRGLPATLRLARRSAGQPHPEPDRGTVLHRAGGPARPRRGRGPGHSAAGVVGRAGRDRHPGGCGSAHRRAGAGRGDRCGTRPGTGRGGRHAADRRRARARAALTETPAPGTAPRDEGLSLLLDAHQVPLVVAVLGHPPRKERAMICATCAVEYDGDALPEVCPICADERQWVPADGQHWQDLDALRASGQRLVWAQAEPGRVEITAEPKVGIGQTAQLVHTPAGLLLWDPPGYIDAETVERVRTLGPVLAVAASHPHMFGVQTEWSAALAAPVLVCEPDAGWLGRSSDRVQLWDGD